MATDVNIKKYEKLDTWYTFDILFCLFDSQLSGLLAIKSILPELEEVVNHSLENILAGGRLIFVGAGTSGRLASQEACELFPTFSWPKNKTLFLMAGGKAALSEQQEGAEDNVEAAQNDASNIGFTKNDVVICISASGNTPYTLSVLKAANQKGAYTVGVVCAENTDIFKESKGNLFLNTGEEVINGSTRMAAGTAQKVVLNMMTTALMVKLNRVYDSFMVDLAVTNKKLEKRAISIISTISNVDIQTATKALFDCNKEVKLACAYLKYGGIELAKNKLRENNYNLRLCLEQE